MADGAKKTAIEVSSKAVEFFMSLEASSLALKSSLELLEIELERFPLFSAGSKLLVCFTAFAEVITGDDFESKERSVKEQTSPEINAVFRARNELLAEIERQFKVHYC